MVATNLGYEIRFLVFTHSAFLRTGQNFPGGEAIVSLPGNRRGPIARASGIGDLSVLFSSPGERPPEG